MVKETNINKELLKQVKRMADELEEIKKILRDWKFKIAGV
jgi:hypothetical protein